MAPLIYLVNARSEWSADLAPAARTAPDHWTTGNKDAIGTAFSRASPVWFTAVHGTLADVLYPTVDRDNVRQFGFLVTDGSSFFFDASSQGVASSYVTDERALVYQLRVNDPAHHFTLVTELAADSSGPVIVLRTHLTGDISRLHVYAYLVPHLDGSGAGQTAFFDGNRGYVSKGQPGWRSRMTPRWVHARRAIWDMATASTSCTSTRWQTATGKPDPGTSR